MATILDEEIVVKAIRPHHGMTARALRKLIKAGDMMRTLVRDDQMITGEEYRRLDEAIDYGKAVIQTLKADGYE